MEALRGPAAALYGNGAGGVILFESAAPYAGPYRQTATVVAGSDGLLRVQATGSGTAGDLAFRASVARNQFDGFRDNDSGSREDPYSQAIRTTLNAGLTTRAGPGTLAFQLSGLDLDALNPGSLPADLFDEGSNQAWGFNVRRGTRKYVRQGQAGMSWRVSSSGFEASFSAYGVRRELDNPIPTSVIDLKRNGSGVRVVLGPRSRGGRSRLDFGVEAELQNDDRRNFANDGGKAGSLTLDQQERVRANAVFGQIQVPVGDRLDVLGALRLDRFNFSADDRFQAADNPDDSGSRTMSGLNPSLGIHLDLGDHGMFTSVARSFETPTTTELANQPDRAGGFNPELEPQRGWTVEAGMRGDLSRWAAYGPRRLLDDAHQPAGAVRGPLRPGAPILPQRRGFARAGIRGVGPRGAVASADRPRRLRICRRPLHRLLRGGNDYADNCVPGIAPHRIEGSLRASGGPWFGELRVEARGEVPANDANDASAEGYRLVELRVGASGIRAGGMRLSPFAAVTNLTNERYASSVVVNAFGGRYFEPGPDRGGHVGLSMTWDRGR